MRVRTPGGPAPHLTLLRSDLAEFVPPFVRAWVAADPKQQHRTEHGTILVACAPDRSPVPLLGDALEIARARGGEVVKFSGDRIVVFFRGHDAERRADATGTDLATRFQVSVARASGAVEFFLLGCSHHELIVTGAPVGEALQLDATPRIPSRIAPAEAPPTKVTWPSDLVASSYVPEVIRRRAAEGTDASQTRDLVVGFVHLANLDELQTEVGLETTTQHLGDLIARVQRSFVEHDVAFVRSDVAVGGPVIVCATGILRTSTNDDDRLLRALHEITDYPSPIELRIAVDRGPVRSGFVASTFVAMGEAITHAAELMEFAGSSEILATASVIGRLSTERHRDKLAKVRDELVYRITKPTKHKRGVVNMLLNLGTLAFEHDDFPGARHYFEDALLLSRNLGHQADEALVLTRLGHVALAMGDAELAMIRCDESLRLRFDLDDQLGTAETLALLGRARYADGDTASARLCWRRAVEIVRSLS